MKYFLIVFFLFFSLIATTLPGQTCPVEVGAWGLGPSKHLDLSGDIAYVESGRELLLLDISYPVHPVERSRYLFPEIIIEVITQGEYVFVALSNELRILDVMNAWHPVEVGCFDMPGSTRELTISGSYLYIVDDTAGLIVVDISDPVNPLETGRFTPPVVINSVFVSGAYAYLTDQEGLYIIDVSDPANLFERSYYDVSYRTSDLVVSGSFAFVGSFTSSQFGENAFLVIVDISDPRRVQNNIFHKIEVDLLKMV